MPLRLERRVWSTKPAVNAPTPLADPETLIRAIRNAFPHVKNPTAIQAELIPAIHSGQDVILMDETGSGKTFGSVLALLSEAQRSHLGVTTLFIVPHRDLAYQIEHWCQKLLAGHSSGKPFTSHVQVLARPHVDDVLAHMKKSPPRVLIATPGALIDGIMHSKNPLKLHLSLQRIIVDEVDVTMKLWDRYQQPRQSRRHIPEAAQAIDRVLEDIWRIKRPKPQMVMMSATLWVHVRTWLFAQNGWMAERVVRLNGVKNPRDEEDDFASSSNDRFVHSAVVVEPDGSLRNMVPAGEEQDAESGTERGILSQSPARILEALEDDATSSAPDTPRQETPSQSTPERTFSEITAPPSVFEAIATSVALDVTNRAMCVFPAGSPVIPIVQEFRKLGVNARLLDLRRQIWHISRPGDSETASPASTSEPKALEKAKSTLGSQEVAGRSNNSSSDPTLLITTTNCVRGLDIPTLSHIYIVGGVDSVAVYRHVAGRVGRFGMHGTVISFVDAVGSRQVGGFSGEKRLQNYLKRMGANVVPFKHIQ